MQVALIGTRRTCVSEACARMQHELLTFPDVQQFLQESHPTDCVLVALESQEAVSQALMRLRSDERTVNKLLYHFDNSNKTAVALADGCLTDSKQLDRDLIKQRKVLDTGISAALAESPERRLVQFLALHRGMRLTPVANWQSQLAYDYPLITALLPDEKEPLELLEALAFDQLIESHQLVDTIHTCTDCHSAHLNFIETCPECGDLNISEVDMIHCFCCGRVDKRSEYEADEGMKCTDCNSKLKHHGEHYDIPLESHACHSCEQAFHEPVVKARCMQCSAQSDPAALKRRTIYDFRMGTPAIAYLQQACKPVMSQYRKVDGVSEEAVL